MTALDFETVDNQPSAIETVESDILNLPPIKRNDGKRRVMGWTADLHVLSKYGLAPLDFKDMEGNPLIPNKAQQKLLKHYMSFAAELDEVKADTVNIVGDILHGQNIKEAGIQVMSTNLDDQVSASVEMLKPIVRGRRAFFWSGSGYHRSTRGHNPEMDICNHKDLAIEAESTHWMGPIANMMYSPSEKVFNVQHGVTKAYIYLAMIMEREINDQLVAEALEQVPEADVIIHAHSHKFRHLHEHKKHMILLPCWNMYAPWHGSLLSYGKFQPDIGGVITLLDDGDRLDVWHFLYPVPRVVGDVQKG